MRVVAIELLRACPKCASEVLRERAHPPVVGLQAHGDGCAQPVSSLSAASTGEVVTHVLVCHPDDRDLVADQLDAVLARYGGDRRLVLVCPRRPAPDVMVAEDDRDIRSYIVSADIAGSLELDADCFDVVEETIGPGGFDILVAQLPLDPPPAPAPLEPATWIIPHRGPVYMLDGCLRAVVAAADDGEPVEVVFDEEVGTEQLAVVARHPRARFHRVEPPGTGPYVPRHAIAERVSTPLIAWQDSDDVPTLDRLEVLRSRRAETGADMVSSQELRVDPVERTLRVRRFALHPQQPLELGLAGAMLVGAAMITAEAFRELGGYSTDLRFGADLQFLFRASLSHRLSNTNEVLYVRRVRPDSQTSHPATGFDSMERRQQLLTFRWQLANVRRGVLPLEQSALAPARTGVQVGRIRSIEL